MSDISLLPHHRALLAAAALEPCIACGNPRADGVGAFIPYAQHGVKPGKLRVYAYALCSPCRVAVPPDEIEALLWDGRAPA